MLPVTQTRLIDSPDIEKYLVKQIATLFMLKGQEISEAALLMQSQLLKQELEKYFPSIEQKTFEVALSSGVRGDFGEYMGLNIITYNSWIKANLQRPKCNKPPQTEYTQKPSPEQLLKLELEWKAAIHKQFAEFKLTGRLDIVFTSQQYKSFVERNILQGEDFKSYIESAKRHIIENKKMERIKSPHHKLKSISDIINRIGNGVESESDIGLIESQAKKECIENYYRSINKLHL